MITRVFSCWKNLLPRTGRAPEVIMSQHFPGYHSMLFDCGDHAKMPQNPFQGSSVALPAIMLFDCGASGKIKEFSALGR